MHECLHGHLSVGLHACSCQYLRVSIRVHVCTHVCVPVVSRGTPHIWVTSLQLPIACAHVYLPIACAHVYLPIACARVYLPIACARVYLPIACARVYLPIACAHVYLPIACARGSGGQQGVEAGARVPGRPRLSRPEPGRALSVPHPRVGPCQVRVGPLEPPSERRLERMGCSQG